MKVLHLGEIVGRAGIFCIKTKLAALKKERGIDFVLACGDGTTNGYGLGKNHALQLRKMGIDAVSAGDMAFYKKDIVPVYDSIYHLVRPANLPPDAPGRGLRFFTLGDKKVAVIVVLGQAGFHRMHGSNPYLMLPDLVKRAKAETPYVLIDFHAVTTAEKTSMALYADGKVSAIFGTGLRCLTADGEVLPNGTASISDCGRTGSLQSVAGFDPQPEIEQFISAMPQRSMEAWEGLEVQGFLVELDEQGVAIQCETLRLAVTEKPHGISREDNED